MKKQLALIISVVSIYTIATPSAWAASEGDKLWVNTYGGSAADYFQTIYQSGDQSYIVGGYSLSNGGDVGASKGGSDLLLAKIDDNGNKVWMKNFGGSLDETLYNAKPMRDGSTLIAGSSKSSNGDFSANKGGSDFVLGKIDASGNKVWMKNFGGTLEDFLYFAAEAPDGSIYTAGVSTSSDGDLPANKGGYDLIIGKFDANGNKLWLKNYGSSAADNVYSAQITADGGLVLAGSTSGSNGDISSNAGFTDGYVAKFNAAGDKEWIKTFGGSTPDVLYSVVQTNDGSFVTAGTSSSLDGDLLGKGSNGSNDFLVVKFDSTGNVIWKQTYGGTSTDYLKSISIMQNGDYIASGYSASNDGDVKSAKGGTDAVILKLSKEGDLRWLKQFGGTANDYANNVIQNKYGSFIFVGYTSSSSGDVSSNLGVSDFLIGKLYFDPFKIDVQLGITGSPLSMTTPGLTSNFGNVALTGSATSVNAALSTLTVSDFTGLGSGWRVSLSATPFAEKAPDGTWDTEGTRLTLPTGSMKLYPFSSTIASSGHSTAPTVSLISPVSIDGAGTIGLLSAAVGQGMDEYQYLFPAQSLTLNVGTQTKVDSINYPSTPTVFESTLSWTLVVGP